MKEIIIFGTPRARDMWHRVFESGGLHVNASYGLKTIIEPEKTLELIKPRRVDIAYIDTSDLKSKSQERREVYLNGITTIARKLSTDPQINKRLALFLPKELPIDMANMISLAFTFNVYDLFKPENDSKGQINVSAIVNQLRRTSNINDAMTVYKVAQAVIENQANPATNISNGATVTGLDTPSQSFATHETADLSTDKQDIDKLLEQLTSAPTNEHQDSEDGAENTTHSKQDSDTASPRQFKRKPRLKGERLPTLEELSQPQKPSSTEKEKVLQEKRKVKHHRSIMPLVLGCIVACGLVGGAIFFIQNGLSQSAQTNATKQEKTNSRVALAELLTKHEWSKAALKFPQSDTRIDNYILGADSVNDKISAVNTVYETLSKPSASVQLDYAYFHHQWKTVVKEQKHANLTQQRKVMLSKAYLALGNLNEAKKMAKEVNLKPLNEQISAYEQLTKANQQIQDKLKNGNLSNDDKNKLQASLSSNNQTLKQLTNN
ncbi:hypothetical protein ACI3E1_07315 [Ligilactobacillus sp. LYQ139]|uniref:hypothetical protein n=1 Tax=Ligilactobacillus sp. LYQ139 TaxID=3378800 RepID=UPI003854E01B